MEMRSLPAWSSSGGQGGVGTALSVFSIVADRAEIEGTTLSSRTLAPKVAICAQAERAEWTVNL